MPHHSGDIEIFAAATAEELCFDERPEVDVRFARTESGDAGQDTTRENVDSPIQPGKRYRRVYVATRIWNRV
jgi:hypothetical protein